VGEKRETRETEQKSVRDRLGSLLVREPLTLLIDVSQKTIWSTTEHSYRGPLESGRKETSAQLWRRTTRPVEFEQLSTHLRQQRNLPRPNLEQPIELPSHRIHLRIRPRGHIRQVWVVEIDSGERFPRWDSFGEGDGSLRIGC